MTASRFETESRRTCVQWTDDDPAKGRPHLKMDRVPMQDGMRAEYDLKNLRVRKVGPDRKRFGEFVDHLRSDRGIAPKKSTDESCK